MWNPFKRKKKEINPQRNIIDELANKLNRDNRFHEIEDELKKLNLSDLNEKEKEAWFHLYGIHAFQKADHHEAAKRFTEGLKQVPNSHMIKFSLGQEFIYLKNPKKAFELFDECEYPKLPREFILEMSRYAYLYSEYERGIRYVSQFLPFYWNVKILDDHFLYVRGLPFFSVTWNHLAVHCILSEKIDELNKITNKTKVECHDYDFDYLEIASKAYISNEYQKLIEKLEKDREKYNASSTYNRARLVCLQIFNADNYLEAINLLETIKHDANDFRWLLDVILLAKAAMANKFNMKNEEAEYINKFLLNQPLLFNPENALSFGFIPYQEKIKKIIQSSK